MDAVLPFNVAALQGIESNFAPVVSVVGANRTKRTAQFDDTTEEYRNGKFVVPGTIDTTGTVTFRAYIWAATAVAARFVELRFGHRPMSTSDNWDVAWVNEDSGDEAIDATQDDITIAEWTETVTNLGWLADDLVGFRISRIAPGGTNLVGDMNWDFFAIEIPLL